MTSAEKRVFLRAGIVFTGGVLTSLIASTAGSDLTLNEIFVAIGSGFGLASVTGGAEVFSKTVNPNVGPGKP